MDGVVGRMYIFVVKPQPRNYQQQQQAEEFLTINRNGSVWQHFRRI